MLATNCGPVHQCPWCHVETAALEVQEEAYSAAIASADEEIERLGGSLRCAPEDKDRVEELGGQAASAEEDRADVRRCLEWRMPS
jgi:hypothetical protein